MEATMRRHSWTDPRSGKRHEYWTKREDGYTAYSFDQQTWHSSFKEAAVPVLRTEAVLSTDGEDEWRLFVEGELTAPTFNSKSAAEAYGDLIRAGLRRPEWSRKAVLA